MARTKGSAGITEQKEREIMTTILVSNSTEEEISKRFDVSSRTVRKCKKKLKTDPQCEELREEFRQKFSKQSQSIIEKALKVLDKKLDRVLKNEKDIDESIKKILASEDLKESEKYATVKKLNDIKIDNLTQISTVIGTLYDKQALINQEATSNVNVTVNLEKMLEAVEGEDM